jgi:hypothetical protein
MTTPADSIAVMETMFHPSALIHNFPLYVHHQRHRLTEFQLLPDLTWQDLLDTGISAEDFRRYLDEDEKVVSMAPGVFVSTSDGFEGHTLLSVGKRSLHFSVYQTDNATREMAMATCDFIVRLFAISNSEWHDRSIIIKSDSSSLPVSEAALAFLFEESRGNVRSVCLSDCSLNEGHIRALSTESRPDVELELSTCKLVDNVGCRKAFVECLQNNRGPTEISGCDIDHRVLANALRNNTRVTSICLWYTRYEDQIGQGELFRALASNRGLVELRMAWCSINKENWAVLCESLQGHPTLTSLSLAYTCPLNPSGISTRANLSKEQKRDRTRMVADMMRENTILQTINLCEDERDEQICTDAILPHLLANRYRPRVLAVTETRDRDIREKVLGRALYSVKSNPNLVWMFLSKNTGAFVPLKSNGTRLSQRKWSVGIVFAALCDIWIHMLAARLFERTFPNQYLVVTLLRVAHEAYITWSFATSDAVWTLWTLQHAVSVSMAIGDHKLLWPTWFQYAMEGLVLQIRASISLESVMLAFALYVGLVGYRDEKLRQAVKIFDAKIIA